MSQGLIGLGKAKARPKAMPPNQWSISGTYLPKRDTESAKRLVILLGE